MHKILMLGQFAPPVTGEAMVNEKVYQLLTDNSYAVDRLNTSLIEDANSVGKFSFSKVFKLVFIYWRLGLKLWGVKEVYLTPGQTYLGILRLLPVLFMCRLARVKVVAHWHGYGILWLLQTRPRLVSYVLNRAHQHIFLTEHLKNEVQRLNPEVNNIEVITNYVEPATTSSRSLHSEPMRVVYLGSLMEEKGILALIEAVSQLPQLHFTICGTGAAPIVNHIETLARRVSNLDYLGVVGGDEKARVLADADVFVLQTHYPTEGVPLSILEAMAARCAIVTTRHNGIPETVGDSALFVEPNSVSSLTAMLLHLHQHRDELQQYADQALARSAEFSSTHFEQRILAMINSGLEKDSLIVQPNKVRVVLTSLNYAPELTGIGKYNGELGPQLVARGFDVSAIVAPPYYPQWQVADNYSSWRYQSEIVDGVRLTRCPLYVPKQVTTLKRLLHLSSFAISSSFALLKKLFSGIDVIILVQPTLFCAPMVLLFGKLAGAKTIMHIQDYEVDAMFGLGLMGESKVSILIRKVEHWLTNKFDLVSTISYSMMERAKQKGIDEDKLLYFPNWSDIDFVTPDTDGEPLKRQWGFSAADQVVLYAGNMGKKQGLEMVLEAAQAFAHETQIKFVLVGTGAHVDALVAHAQQLGLNNVYFKPLQAWEDVPQMLALADVHLVVQKKGAADAVLPSKLTNILSAGGHALVTTDEDSELGRLAQRFPGIYACVEPESLTALVDGLSTLLAADLSRYNRVARQFAEEHLDQHKIIDAFAHDLGKVTSGQPVLPDMEGKRRYR